MKNAQTLSVVIPIYNESENLLDLVSRTTEIFQIIRDRYGLNPRYVFIDDGSADGSFGILKSLDYAGYTATLIQFSRNFGKEAALSAGIDASVDADLIVLMDADLQHPPELLLSMLDVWKEGGVDSVFTYKDHRRSSEGLLKSSLTGASTG